MKEAQPPGALSSLSRRQFLGLSAVAGAGAAVWPSLVRAAAAVDEIRVVLIGAGRQGRTLLKDCLKIPGIRFTAVCDIWSFSQRYASNILKKYGQPVHVYLDYREMLANEKDFDAAIVATPDWMHPEHTIACLQSGKHVYCEKEISIDIPTARKVIAAARSADTFLQVGHQRRSNPVYQFALQALDRGDLCGRLTSSYAQWHRAAQERLDWPAKHEIPAAALKQYGYDTMDRFRNWRWYRKFSAGPISDLGSHQIDIFNWFLHGTPTSLLATAGSDYYEDREWPGDIIAIYEYATKAGSVRALYEVLNTNGFGGFFERFYGDAGTFTISEDPQACYYVPEAGRPPPAWMADVERVQRAGYQAVPLVPALERQGSAAARLMAAWQRKTIHQWHLENFFDAIRAADRTRLTCPPEAAYPTAVAVLSAHAAIDGGTKVVFKEDDFKA